MGLDMFLDGVNYYPAKYDEEGNTIEKRKIVQTLEIYWRKANHIHKWFVENVQWDNDDCGFYDVSHENLIELRDLCQKVIDNPEKAKDILPTQEGFFFGGTEYDEWYFNDTKTTINEINKLLEHGDEYDWFQYHSSW